MNNNCQRKGNKRSQSHGKVQLCFRETPVPQNKIQTPLLLSWALRELALTYLSRLIHSPFYISWVQFSSSPQHLRCSDMPHSGGCAQQECTSLSLLCLFTFSSSFATHLDPSVLLFLLCFSKDQWFSRCGPWPAANLLDLKILRSHHRHTEKLGVGWSVVEQGFQVILTHINIWVTSPAHCCISSLGFLSSA